MSEGRGRAGGGRGYRLKRLGTFAACASAVAILAFGIPSAQQAQLAHRCAGQGGQLKQSVEALEPVLAARTVYTCYSPGGQVLQTW